MTHEALWRALDALAAERNLSPSGLARLAGLDPTSFNRSKRDGRRGPRWPGTESLARVLSATGIGLDRFAILVAAAAGEPLRNPAMRPLPVLEFSRLGGVAPDDAVIAAADRMAIASPNGGIDDEAAYLVRLDAGRFSPALRERDLLLVSPGAAIARGDRVLAFTGTDTVACLAGDPSPARLDTGDMLAAPSVLHRIGWIGCGAAAG